MIRAASSPAAIMKMKHGQSGKMKAKKEKKGKRRPNIRQIGNPSDRRCERERRPDERIVPASLRNRRSFAL